MSQMWLITGVAGFIGSHVAEHLLAQGHSVVGLDNLSTGSIQNIKPFSAHPNWHWFQGDINGKELTEIFDHFPITHVLHLAAMVSIQACESMPDQARFVNEQGFDRVLQTAGASGVQQFLYASSSAVYGCATHLPISESTALQPISLYGQTKVNNELSAEKYCADNQISCIGFRFFNLFGPRQAVDGGYAAVIPKWVDAIKQNKQPIIFGDGTATRDFCPIANVLSAIDCTVKAGLSDHHVFNIGNGQETRLKTLYHTLCEILGKHPEPQYRPWRSDDILHSCADISLAKKILGYEPKVSLEKGLINLIV